MGNLKLGIGQLHDGRFYVDHYWRMWDKNRCELYFANIEDLIKYLTIVITKAFKEGRR